MVNLFSGSGTQTGGASITGGSQSNGGLDDFNNGESPSVGRYEGSWTVCDTDNDYCGTEDDAAKVRDDSTGLIWSHSCSGSECSSISTEASPLTYSWDASGANNNSKTAQHYVHQGHMLKVDGIYRIKNNYFRHT